MFPFSNISIHQSPPEAPAPGGLYLPDSVWTDFAPVDGNVASAIYAIDGDGFRISFHHSASGQLFEYARAGSPMTSSDLASANGEILFTAAADVDYVAAADMTFFGKAALLRANLYEMDAESGTVSETLLASDQWLRPGPFVPGSDEGAMTLLGTPNLIGNGTGRLRAGHTYLFEYAADIGLSPSSFVQPIGPMSADGVISLSFTRVPEPSVAVAFIGVMAVGLVGRYGQQIAVGWVHPDCGKRECLPH